MFENWYLTELFSPKIRNVWKLTDYYLLKLIFDIFQKTGIDRLLVTPHSIDEIIIKQNYTAKVSSALKWMLERLTIDEYVIKTHNPHDRYVLSGKKMDYNLIQLKDKAGSMAPDSLAAFNMLHLIADFYPDYLSGKINGIDVIFSPANIETTSDYYVNNLFYNVHNILGAKIVNWDISTRQNPVVIEIGGGLGGGTKEFCSQYLQSKETLNGFTYYFTDIANKMLRTTKNKLSTLVTNLDSFIFQKLDFNKPLSEQGFPENSVDVIWGVNAIHVASDLRWTLTEFYKTLKPGGSLIVSETVRPVGNPMIQQELLLNTIDDYWNVKLDPDIRPRYGFMDWTDWVRAFKKIGFSPAETVPDMDFLQQNYDNCYVAVTRGVKPEN